MGTAETIWFDEDRWIGSSVSFAEPRPSDCQWRLDRKLAEHGYLASEDDVKECMMCSEARGVFVCSRVDDSMQEQEAVVKIQMQIPYFNTTSHPRDVRARQADPDNQTALKQEVSALAHLTQTGCSSTPNLLAWKHDTQGADDWVPGGYINYILMERLPGKRPEYWSGGMSRPERDQLREGFKRAWLECVSHGRVNEDCGIRDLIWHQELQKCYIVDWEDWRESTDSDVWQDTEFISWNLAWVRSHNYDDMSTWTL